MSKQFELTIPGAQPTGEYTSIYCPWDRQEIARIESANSAMIEQAMQNARQTFDDRSNWLPAEQRALILRRAAQIMTERAESLAQQAAQEGGKPLIDSRVEVARAIDGIYNCIECLRSEHGQEIPMGINPASSNRLAFTTLEPIGPVLAYSAFNHPLNLIVHQVGPAIAAGCPVIIKPAQDTPISCLEFVSILHEAGLPAQWCQALMISSRELTSNLVTDSRIAFFSFIGSAQIGWMLRGQIAPGVRCAMEHGGAAPVIIERDADLVDAQALIAKAGFYHAGQVCVSVQRVYCHSSIAESFAHNIAQAGSQMKVGDPTLEDTDIGPLIRPKEVERIEQWVNEAVDAGAECLAGGSKLSDTCYPATTLLNPPDDCKVSQLEIFGPVICIYSYDELDEAIERANQLPFAFQAAIFTQDIDRAMYAARRLEASAVMINDHTAFRVDWMPFAGLKQSGLGTGGIPYTYRDLHNEKMLVIRSKDI